MNELFGLSMTTIMVVLLAIFAVAVASVAFVFITNRVMFRMGLRNLPRRGLQTGLVVVGLMLATLITTAAFTTGDTIDYSISKVTFDDLQRTDLTLNPYGEDSSHEPGVQGPRNDVYFDQRGIGALEQAFTGDPDIDGFMPFLFEPVAALNTRSKLSEPTVMLAGIDPTRLGEYGGLRNVSGGQFDLATLRENDVLLSKREAGELDARLGDTITIYSRGSAHDVYVAGIVENELASGSSNAAGSATPGGAAMRLSTVQSITGHAGQVNHISIALKGDVRSSVSRSDAAAARLQPYISSAEGRDALGVGNRNVKVETYKQDSVDSAEEFGNLFTTFFLVLGLFSIASGVMLIFMIFVMLAAERKPEMGMARAVGAQRGNLVQSFMSEGMAYSVIAGAVGAAFGVMAALAILLGILQTGLGSGGSFITAHVTVRSLVVSYCLGVVVTFLTVVISSMKVSAVNIVGAIRGTEDDDRRLGRRKTNWKWLAIGVPSMIVPPLGIWFFFRKGFGLPWAWIIAPCGILLSGLALLGASGGGGGSQFLAGFGFSIIPLCIAMLAAYYRLPGRAIWTAVGAYLLVYWLSPVDLAAKALGTELEGDIEMFLMSGIMVVIGFTLVIVFNARLLTALFRTGGRSKYRVAIASVTATVALGVAGMAIGNQGDGLGQLLYLFAGVAAIVAAASFAAARYPRFAPALKMGVAYPLSNRFRTGMTIAMFALIIFSLTVFSIINANFAAKTAGKSGDGGWNVVATANRNNPIGSLPDAVRDTGAPVADEIASSGRVTIYTGVQKVQQVGVNDKPESYPVIAADDGFLSNPKSALDARANGYESDRSVFDAVRTDAKYALVDGSDFSEYDWEKTVDINDKRFKAFDVVISDPVSGKSETVTVIGVMSLKLTSGFAGGIYVNADAYQQVFGEPQFLRTYIGLHPGVNARDAARGIESALTVQGVQADSIKKLIDDSVAQDQAFNRMFQSFMALGLFVGIASLGVIAFRSVVERRQQIGMLRAIGYQSGTVALTFVLESSFIALMGILSGVVGGTILGRNLMTSGQFADLGTDFTIPWVEVIGFAAIAFVFSLLMTWWPSRGAANVPVADALRYE
jgi:putative ABC transport system permease protein